MTLIIIISIIVYLIIGRISSNFLVDNGHIDDLDWEEWVKFWVMLFFPIIWFYVSIKLVGDKINGY